MPVIDQGFEETKYQIISRTLIFLFDSNNQVLLIKGADTKHRWPGKYNGIGGHIEGGEDILEAGLRELQEESGIKDVELSLIGQIMVLNWTRPQSLKTYQFFYQELFLIIHAMR